MSFGITNENEVFAYHEIRLKKTATKKLLLVTMAEHLNFNEHITNVRKIASRKLNALSRASSLLSYWQKKVVLNSFISGQFNFRSLIRMFSSIRSYRKISKLHRMSLRLCHNNYTSSYDELLSKQNLVNIHIRNNQKLMVEILKCLKGLSLPNMNWIFMLRNMPYNTKIWKISIVNCQKLYHTKNQICGTNSSKTKNMGRQFTFFFVNIYTYILI